MRTSFDCEVLNRITYLTGSADYINKINEVTAKIPFDEQIVDFLNEISKEVMKDPRSKMYSDVVTFGFWIRKGSVLKLKERFEWKDEKMRLGKGVAFHIAPSNVPCNFAYSLVSGLLMGNANIVRIPSKAFPQVSILIEVFNKVLNNYQSLKPYVILIRYERDKDVNDYLSSISDIRIIWGGNQTISEVRKSTLPSRSGDITFADRYSLAVIDSDSYMAADNKSKVAEDFYNDTFFSDQNACTSPRMIVWTGNAIKEAKKVFWEEEYKIVKNKYSFQPIQVINKLTKCLRIAADQPGIKVKKYGDNRIIRIDISKISENLMDYYDNSGYFFEYDCKDILDIKPLCNDKRCQTIAYFGDKETIMPLLQAGIKGIDRVVPVGKTMDFDLIWDGYNLPSLLTRTIVMI